MKHLGDITKINGAEATPVNVIIGGRAFYPIAGGFNNFMIGGSTMSSMRRKILRNIVRCSAEKQGVKPSRAVHNWRYILKEADRKRGRGNGKG